MAKKKPPMGHDPLAWMSEVDTIPSSAETTDSQDTVQTQVPETASSVVENIIPSVVASEPIPSESATSPKSTHETTMIEEPILPSFNRSWITVELESILTLSNLPQLHEQLCQYKGKRVELVGDKVTRIDTAALQLLFAFISSSDITVTWKTTPSEEIINAARLLGLSTQLSIKSVESII